MNSTDYVKAILKRPTDRDKQRKVGGSNIVNACTRCLADDLLGVPREQGLYDMGAILGTAIHAYLEERNMDPAAFLEYKLGIGYIPGYGKVGSRLDLYRSDARQVIDLKTSTRDKMRLYQRIIENGSEDGFDTDQMETARYTLESYVRQVNVYAWALAQDGYPVETVSIVFVCRDGSVVDQDVWGFEMPYNPSIAVKVWERTTYLWEWLQDPENLVEDLESHNLCYYCNNVRPLHSKPKVTL